MKKIGICTLFTGFNYGSALQAYATKCIVSEIGFDPVILKLSGSIIKGRDIRIKKMFAMLFRGLVHPNVGKKTAFSFADNYNSYLSLETKKLFITFYNNMISPKLVSYKTLKTKKFKNDFLAFLCGSDQVWNAGSLYVDPFYYLRFTSKKNRIAFAPSFGREEIPKYNKKIIKKYITGFDCLSVREESGAKIIKELCNKNAVQLIDPTLALSRDFWKKNIVERKSFNSLNNYLLAYFLGKPSELAIQQIEFLKSKFKLNIVSLPYSFNDFGWKTMNAGPIEFLSLIYNASFVVTDSFHGVAFSINFNKQFYVYSRNYGSASNQSTRIVSLLEKVDLLDRFDNRSKEIVDIDFSYSNIVLEGERKKTRQYLLDSISYSSCE